VALAWPLTWRSPLRAFDFPGCTWTNAAERALTAWQPDLGTAFSERLPQIPEPERAPFLVSLGSHLRGQVGEQVPVLDPRWRVHLRRGLTRREAQPGLPPEATSDLAGWLTRANAGQARALGQSLMGEIDASPLRRTHALSAAVTTTTVAPLCEGLGEGLVRAHKTPTDLLRWRIPWDGLLAPGCQAAFDRGLSEALIATYADDPAYRDRALALFGLEAP
jgi:hypothetical protein